MGVKWPQPGDLVVHKESGRLATIEAMLSWDGVWPGCYIKFKDPWVLAPNRRPVRTLHCRMDAVKIVQT